MSDSEDILIPNREPPRTLGQAIRRARTNVALPMGFLARALKTSVSHISDIERDRAECDPHVLRQIAYHLATTPEEIYALITPSQTPPNASERAYRAHQEARGLPVVPWIAQSEEDRRVWAAVVTAVQNKP